jgi:hypothetical protein
MIGAFMNDWIAYRPLECLTMLELGMLQRTATRYSEIVREHAYLVGLMNLAVRTGDANLLARAKKRLAETELEFKECTSALGTLTQELLGATAAGRDGRAAASQACELATA